MWGNPGENRQSIKQTVNFIRGLNLDDISITFATPYPGSEIWQNIKSYGEFDNDFKGLSCFNPVFIPNDLSAKYLVDSRKKVLREFYFKPKIAISYLKRLKSLAQLKNFILSAYDLFCYTFFDKKYHG